MFTGRNIKALHRGKTHTHTHTHTISFKLLVEAESVSITQERKAQKQQLLADLTNDDDTNLIL